MVGSPDGATMLKEVKQGTNPEQLGRDVAAALIARGADRILAEIGG
jgi:hydroxymethylbilane synthase